jgi:hypothetical protein
MSMAKSMNQRELKTKVLPMIKEGGKLYRKHRLIHARPAKPGEHVITLTQSGQETRNVASTGDMVVENQTMAKERYIVSAETFAKRYKMITHLGNGWAKYMPTGKVRGIELTSVRLDLLGLADKFEIEAPWGEMQVVNKGDFLVKTTEGDDLYAIAGDEFAETYEEE